MDKWLVLENMICMNGQEKHGSIVDLGEERREGMRKNERGETLVPLDESDFLDHSERQDQKIRELEAALAEKEKVAKTVEKMWLKRVTEYEAVINVLKYKGLEICEIMKGQTRQIAALEVTVKEKDERLKLHLKGYKAATEEYRLALEGLQEQIAALTTKNKRLIEALKLYYLPEEIEALRGGEE